MSALSNGRAWLLAAVLVVLAGAWLGPLPQLASQVFAAHMTMHVAVVAVAAPLLAVALGGSPFDPVRRWPRPFHPLLISVVDLVVIWSWHAPLLHHASRHQPPVMAIEQASFLIVGMALWLSAFGGDPALRRQRAAAGIFGLLMTSMHMTLLGVLLALAPRPLYGHGALDDQALGGVLMLTGGGLSYLAGGLWLLADLLRPQSGQCGGSGRPGAIPGASLGTPQAGDTP